MYQSKLMRLVSRVCDPCFDGGSLRELVCGYLLRNREGLAALLALVLLKILPRDLPRLHDALIRFSSRWAYGVSREGFPSRDSKYDNLQALGRASRLATLVQVELTKVEAYEHAAAVMIFRDRLTAYMHAVCGIRRLLDREELGGPFRGVLVERLAVAASCEAELVYRFIRFLSRVSSQEERKCLRERIVSTIPEATENTWELKVNDGSDDAVMLRFLALQLERAAPTGLSLLLSRVSGDEILFDSPALPAQFLGPLARNPSFIAATQILPEQVRLSS